MNGHSPMRNSGNDCPSFSSLTLLTVKAGGRNIAVPRLRRVWDTDTAFPFPAGPK